MKLEGIINYVLFHNDTNGYSVFRFNVKKIDGKVNKDSTKPISVVGILDREPRPDEEYIFEGEYVIDPKFGKQFKFKTFKRAQIRSLIGLITYFSGDTFKGIGLTKAKEIVEHLGKDAITIIRNDPTSLDELKLTAVQKKIIIDGITTDFGNQDAMVFLLDHKITQDMASKIIKALRGEDIISYIKDNPYRLIEIVENFGFKKADALALSIGISKNSPLRIRNLLTYGLKDILFQTGNSYIGLYELFDYLVKSIKEEIDSNIYKKIIQELHDEHKVYIDQHQRVFEYKAYQAEVKLAREIVKMLKDERSSKGIKKYPEKKIDKALEEIIEESAIEFSSEQVEAIRKAFTEPIVIITGGPGTGKTTIIHAILQMYFKLNANKNLLVDNIALLAPTGRASKRLSESTRMEASTIHRFLGYSGDGMFEYDEINRTNALLIIVDEASMMDVSLASRLITSSRDDARIIIVGDVDQLPSVGPGQVLKDLIETQEIKTIRLTKIHRQANDSSIIKLAHSINQGYLPENLLDKLPDRNFIPTEPDNITNIIVDLYDKSLKKGKSIKDIQILIPMYDVKAGINEVNELIQERINPLNNGKQLLHYKTKYRLGDKVIQLVNRVEKAVMNGDIGYITDFIYTNNNVTGLIVKFDNREIEYQSDELDDLALAYAISIHKSQGSEFDIVIMPIAKSYTIMLKRKLIYTGITRAKHALILVGLPEVLQRGIKMIEANRQTILKEEIVKLLNHQSIEEVLKEYDVSSLNLDECESLPDLDECESSQELGECEVDLKDLF